MKYEVEVGGFVTVFRKRKLMVHANNAKEAEDKAIDKFTKLQQKNGAVCEGGHIDSICQI